MRILHFIYDHPRNPWVGGGGALRVWRLAELLALRGHDIHLICGNFPGACSGVQNGVRVSHRGTPRGYVCSTLSYTLAAIRLARREADHFDLLIEDFAPWNPVFTYRVRACPAVVQLQNRFGVALSRRYPVIGWLLRRLEAGYPHRFRHAIVINEALNAGFGIAGEVISMGVDEALLREPAHPGDYVAWLGRLDPYQKGLDLLLATMRTLPLPLRLAGEGPGRGWLQEQIRALRHVTWVGAVHGAAKTEHLRGARFVVVPSRYEGQSLVVLEAAALGKPVLVSDIAELDYAVRAGFALAFASGSVDDLRRQMERLWQEARLQEQLSLCARPFVASRTWPRIADHFEAYCLRVSRRETEGRGATISPPPP